MKNLLHPILTGECPICESHETMAKKTEWAGISGQKVHQGSVLQSKAWEPPCFLWLDNSNFEFWEGPTPSSTTIQNILETRQDELRRLLGKTSSRVASSKHAQRKEFHVTHHSQNVLLSQYAARTAWSGITMDTWWGDNLYLGTRPDTWGTKDRPQRQAPHSCSLVISSNHNYLCLIDHY